MAAAAVAMSDADVEALHLAAGSAVAGFVAQAAHGGDHAAKCPLQQVQVPLGRLSVAHQRVPPAGAGE
jgi:hypothetical protein